MKHSTRGGNVKKHRGDILDRRDLQLIALIQSRRDAGRPPPSYREIAEAWGTTWRPAQLRIERLRRLGILMAIHSFKPTRALTLLYRLEAP